MTERTLTITATRPSIVIDRRPRCKVRHPNQPLHCEKHKGHKGPHLAVESWSANPKETTWN